MAPKRRRDEPGAVDGAGAPDAPGPSSAPAATMTAAVAAAQAPGARANMADLARRRAAHFANFQDDSLEEQGNVHVGTNNVRP